MSKRELVTEGKDINDRDFSEQEIDSLCKLLKMGFRQQKDVQRAFWMNGHCLYIQKGGEITEL